MCIDISGQFTLECIYFTLQIADSGCPELHSWQDIILKRVKARPDRLSAFCLRSSGAGVDLLIFWLIFFFSFPVLNVYSGIYFESSTIKWSSIKTCLKAIREENYLHKSRVNRFRQLRATALKWKVTSAATSALRVRHLISRLTFPGGLEAVEDVYSLDVIGQRGVGQQGAVPIDCVQGKFKG